MYMPPVARLFNAGQPQGHLVQVVKCKPKQNSIQVHLLNSRRKGNGRRTGWELVWAVDGNFGGRNKEKWTPVTDTYKPNFEPWIETVEYQDLLSFCRAKAPRPRGTLGRGGGGAASRQGARGWPPSRWGRGPPHCGRRIKGATYPG